MRRTSTNSQIQSAAMRRVLENERKRVGKSKEHLVYEASSKSCGYDVYSAGRRIEVKGTQGKDPYRGLVLNSLEEYKTLRDGGWLYRVTGVPRGPIAVLRLRWNDLRLTREQRWRVARRAGGRGSAGA